MKIHCLTSPPPEMSLALARFEREFNYPLGPFSTFSISHGDDYTLFFRGLGEARIYLAEIGGEIAGSLAVIGRTASLADGSEIPAAYLCDAKVTPRFRGGMVLGKLATAAREQLRGAGYEAAFSIVMDGSTPSDALTGRLGIPKFEPLGRLAILRFDIGRVPAGFLPARLDDSLACHRAGGGKAGLASEIAPRTIAVEGAGAVLLDTRRGKRLMASDGTEMISAHLAELRFTSPGALARLLEAAVSKAGELGFPGLFAAFPGEMSGREVAVATETASVVVAHATVYGTGLPAGGWLLGTAEI